MHLLVALLATRFCIAVPDLNDRLKPMLYSTTFNESFHQLTADLIDRNYVSAAQLMKKNGYVDGKTQTVSDGAVTFLARGDVEHAMQAYYVAQFCDLDEQSSPDYVSVGATRKLQHAMETWFSGHVGDSKKELVRLLRQWPGFGEANLVRGYITYRSKPNLAFHYWRTALQRSEVPPPDAAPQIAAAELLLHFRP